MRGFPLRVIPRNTNVQSYHHVEAAIRWRGVRSSVISIFNHYFQYFFLQNLTQEMIKVDQRWDIKLYDHVEAVIRSRGVRGSVIRFIRGDDQTTTSTRASPCPFVIVIKIIIAIFVIRFTKGITNHHIHAAFIPISLEIASCWNQYNMISSSFNLIRVMVIVCSDWTHDSSSYARPSPFSRAHAL